MLDVVSYAKDDTVDVAEVPFEIETIAWNRHNPTGSVMIAEAIRDGAITEEGCYKIVMSGGEASGYYKLD